MIIPLRLRADSFGTDRQIIHLPFPLAKLKAYETSIPPKTFRLCCEPEQPIMLSDPVVTVE